MHKRINAVVFLDLIKKKGNTAFNKGFSMKLKCKYRRRKCSGPKKCRMASVVIKSKDSIEGKSIV